MAVGILGCMATLIIEAALIANFVPSDNSSALQAAVAMLYIFQIFYGTGCDGKMEIFSSSCIILQSNSSSCLS
jgi:hypothetical protein